MDKAIVIKIKGSIILLFCVLISSISFAQNIPTSNKINTKSEYTIDLYSAFKNIKTYPLSFITESIEYFPLEKTTDCLLGNHLRNIFFDKKNIIVFDGDNCFRFSQEGKFINKIGKKGRGPGEYNRPMNIAVDTGQQTIYFQDQKRILKYNYEGEFLKEMQTDVMSSKILQYEEGIFLLNAMHYQHAEPGKRFSIRFFDETEEKQIAKVECPKKDKIPFAIDTPNMYKYNGITFIKDFWDNKVFKVENPLSLAPYALINTGKLKHREKDDQQPFGKKNTGDELVVSITYISETDRYIFMGANKGLFFFDKKTKSTKCCDYVQTGEKWSGFTNDISGGPTLLSNNFPRLPLNNNTFVTFNHAYEFFEKGIDTNNKQINELMKTLQPDDNPVLVLVKLKE